MNYTIDIGNTLAKIGVFDSGNLVDQRRFPSWTVGQIIEYLTNQNSRKVILSNVTGFSIDKLISALQDLDVFILLNEYTPLPINNLYQTPKTLGKDRLAAVVGAYSMYPGSNVLIIDAGTCITYDWVLKNGDYLGGNIAPGLKMRLRAMHHFTGNLPLLDVEATESNIGYSTNSAMVNGALMGLLFEIEGFIELQQTRFEDLKIMLTGGDAEFLAKKLKKQIFVDQNLVLVGLNKILDYNASKST